MGQELEVADQSLHTLLGRILIVRAAAAVGFGLALLGRTRWEALHEYPWVLDSRQSLLGQGFPCNP